MVRSVIAAMAVLVLAPVGVSAEHTVGIVGLYSDVAGTDCRVADEREGMLEVHMVAQAVIGLNAIQFAAPIPACWTGATWVADQSPWVLVLGQTQDPVHGISMTFSRANCEASSVYLGKMLVSTQGSGPSCCEFPILKAQVDYHPEVPLPITVLCGDETHVHGIAPVSAWINPDPSCDCLLTLPVEETSWGRLKSLYE